MHAVVVNVTISDREAAQENLRTQVVPNASQAPGFVAGYWMRREGDKGIGVVVFESEDGAQGATRMIEQQPGTDAVTLDSVEVVEVVANA